MKNSRIRTSTEKGKKAQNVERLWFQSEMMEVFLESVKEEEIRK